MNFINQKHHHPTMINYLDVEEIIVIDEIALELTNESGEFQVKDIIALYQIDTFVKNNFSEDIYKKALWYCVALIVYHPFQEGNHRTSLSVAERFLIINGYQYISTEQERTQLQQIRLEYGEKNNLEQCFFNIVNIEDNVKRHGEIIKIMESGYGKIVENWLRKNYIVDTNDVRNNI